MPLFWEDVVKFALGEVVKLACCFSLQQRMRLHDVSQRAAPRFRVRVKAQIVRRGLLMLISWWTNDAQRELGQNMGICGPRNCASAGLAVPVFLVQPQRLSTSTFIHRRHAVQIYILG